MIVQKSITTVPNSSLLLQASFCQAELSLLQNRPDGRHAAEAKLGKKETRGSNSAPSSGLPAGPE